MKRSNEQQHTQQQYNESNKKPRYTQPSYSDMYAQYGLMSQYSTPFVQPNAANAAVAAAAAAYAYNQPTASMYNMAYTNPQSMMTAQYNPAYPQSFLPAATQAASAEISRTIYLGNVTNEMDPAEILRHVHTGALEQFRVVPEKSCAFLSFIDPSSAQLFYQEFKAKKLIINNIELKIGWGKANMLSNALKLQIQSGATRNVYLGRIDPEQDTEEFIRSQLARFGEIENVKIIKDKTIAFVHFYNIQSAIKCVTTLPADPLWQTKKVNYGKDHCANEEHIQQQFVSYTPFGFDPYATSLQAATSNLVANSQRTLYLGNLHPETTCEDICNCIRGGNLIQVRHLPDKHIAFITFIDANTALNVFTHISNSNFSIKGKRLRIGWGKPSGISNQVAMAIQNGATRNIYIGGIDDSLTVEKLKQDFQEFGEIELVNIFKEKNCAFVNFTSINSAMTALNGIKQKSEYTELKINYGKDRCGNPWKLKKKPEDIPVKKTEEIKKEDNQSPSSSDLLKMI